ncbi:MAG TPA: hypothetical protein DCQ90_00335 [Erysipelotrichaceae bacterium]|nr:MAG: hypothetical protein A2Y19_09930 [Firmicutes bacterium GWE2_51_13]HAO60422.1 hypothetical protein [Erysipelotrichaceae bacterium]
MKAPKLLIEYLSIGVPLMLICIILLVSGKVSLSTYSFALDSAGKLYVGKESKLEVYSNESLLMTIFPMTTKGYLFTIEYDDTILLSDASTVYIMDLTGIVLSQREDRFSETFSTLNNSKKTFVSRNGDNYQKRSIWGRDEIIHVFGNDEIVIYRMPLLDYIVKILFWALLMSGFIIAPIILLQWKRMKN